MPQDRTLTETAQVYVAGDVVVAPDVTIAPGAVLQANPGSRLVIEARVCIGAQVVIQAYGGELNLQAGVNVGPGGLLLGQGRIGENACIGAESTLIHPQVAAAAVVPAHSLWGHPRESGQSSSTASETHGRQTSVNSTADGTPGESSSTLEAASIPDAAGPLDTNGAGVLATHTVIYGREQVTQLIATLFPHRRPLTSSDETSSS
jgi:carbon dioxide concentrating mechanism protein CcmN